MTDPIEAVAKAIAEVHRTKFVDKHFSLHMDEARAAIAAYTKAVSSEAVGHVAKRPIDEAMANGKLYEPIMMFFGPYAGSFGDEPYLTLFVAPQPVKTVADTEKAALSLANMVTTLVEDCTRLELDYRVGLNTKIKKHLERFVEPKPALESAPQPSLSMTDFLTGMDSIASEAIARQPPAGWKLVPVEPTPEMYDAGYGVADKVIAVWEAMIAVAPEPEAP